MAKQPSAATTYPVIRRDVIGPTALIAPSFPHRCPICGAERTFVQIGQPIANSRCTYACGGGYRPSSPTIHNEDRNHWKGECGSMADAYPTPTPTGQRVAAVLRASPVGSYGSRYLDRLYGPCAAELRVRVASAVHGRELRKSAKECQYGNLRRSLVELFGATGSCIAAVDANLQELIDAQP